MKVYLGDITFLDETIDGKDEAIIYRAIEKELEGTLEEIYDICEELLLEYQGYLIPSLYRGNIIDLRS